jgi:hypothetical protein
MLLRIMNGPLPLERKEHLFILYIIENFASYFDILKISLYILKITYRTAAGHHPGQRVVPAVGAGRLGDPHHGLHLLSFHDCHAALIQVPTYCCLEVFVCLGIRQCCGSINISFGSGLAHP